MLKLPSVQRDSHALHPTLWSPHCSEASYVLCSRQGHEEFRQIIVNVGAVTTPIPIHQVHWAFEAISWENCWGLTGLILHNLHSINHTLQRYVHMYFTSCGIPTLSGAMRRTQQLSSTATGQISGIGIGVNLQVTIMSTIWFTTKDNKFLFKKKKKKKKKECLEQLEEEMF